MLKPLLAALLLLSSSAIVGADKKWPFEQAPNVAVITQKAIVQGKAPVLLVKHDIDDHGWQFMNPSLPVVSSNASVVGLGQMVKLDPTLLEIADLPPGW